MSSVLKIKAKKCLKFIIIFFIFLFIFIELKRFIVGLNINDLGKYWNQLSMYKILAIILLGLVAFLPVCLYDFVIKDKLKPNVNIKYLFKSSWICASASNVIGLGGSFSLALKLHFYKNCYKDRKDFLGSACKILLLNLSGLSVLCIFYCIFNFTNIKTFNLKYISVFILSLYAPCLLSYSVYKHFKTQNTINAIESFKFFLISCIEWILVGLLLYNILKINNIIIPVRDFFPIFIISVTAGVVSMLPGGLGSFDLVFLLSLESMGIDKEQISLVLCLYRLSYYVIPLFLGVLIYFTDSWKKLNKKYNNVLSLLLSSIASFLLRLLILSSGILLLLSAALPSVTYRIKLIRNIVNYDVINISNMFSVIVGLLLISLSRVIHYKSKDVYKLTFILLICGSVFTFSKGLDYEEVLYLFIVGLILFASKNSFYREKFIMTWGRMLQDFAILSFVLFIYVFIGYANMPSSNIVLPYYLQNLTSTNCDYLIIGSITGFVITLICLFILYKTSEINGFNHLTLDNCEDDVNEFLSKYKGTPLTHLMYLNDKMFYFTKDKDVLFQYSVYSDKIVVLGSPIGEKSKIKFAIEEFFDICNTYGYTPIFYQVDRNTLHFLHECGYHFIKLGEEAIVDVNSFSLTGKKMKGIRTSVNKVEKEGYIFEVVNPPFSKEFIGNIKIVSDDWLGEKGEKGFSLGFFDESYINKAPVCIVKDKECNIKGFASIMPMYDNHKSYSIDLMRFSNTSCRGVMDFMFVNLIKYGCENNYKFFNIGMATLSNVGTSKYSFLSEKIAFQIYNHGHHFYSFQGLRAFKEKYACNWEPKYFAYRTKSSLLFTMIQITLLISKNTRDKKNK